MTRYDQAYHRRKIKNAVGWFFVGSFAFVVLEFLLIYLGFMRFIHPEHGWPSSFVIIGLGGLYLFWKMSVAMFFKTPLPDTYKPIDRTQYSEVIDIIEEVTTKLNQPQPHGVYIVSGTNAAVFCRPTMLSMLIKPKQELVIGETLLDVLTTDELRVILYHEFGHYVSGSLGKKIPISVISQFSKSFTSVKRIKKPGGWSNMIHSQVATFSYFVFLLCSIIDKHYKPLSQGEELAADDVAVNNMCSELLVCTLVKVSLLQHYYHYIQWFEHINKFQLPNSERSKIILFLCCNHVGGIKSIPPAIRERIERHMVIDSPIYEFKKKAKQQAVSFSTLEMIIKIHPIYEKARLRSKSVLLKFHLDRKKHKLPWAECKYQILLDDKPIGYGNFIKGFDFSIRTSPGKHIVSVYGVSGIIAVPFEFECRSGDIRFFDMDFKVHISNGYYEIFVASSKII